MSIMALEVRGLGSGWTPGENTIANAISDYRANVARSLALLPGAINPRNSAGAYVEGGDFLTEWGVPIGAGVAGLAIGLVIAKLARKKR